MKVRFVEMGELGHERAESLVAEVLEETSVKTVEWPWLLGYFDDGVVWGRAEGAGWLFSCGPYPALSPRPRRERLQELRLFGPASEALVWRDGQGLVGRVAREAAEISGGDPARPSSERRLVLGSKVIDSKRGFSLVRERDGRRQALPIECATSDLEGGRVVLTLRNYFEQDEETGVVRIAATRLVGLEVEGRVS